MASVLLPNLPKETEAKAFDMIMERLVDRPPRRFWARYRAFDLYSR